MIANAPGKDVSSVEEGLAALEAGEEINFDGASSAVDYRSPTGVLTTRDFGFWVIEGNENKALATVKTN